MNKFTYQHGQLWVENIPVETIIREVGTPCYIYSKSSLIDNWQNFKHAFSKQPHHICYSVKANSNLAVLHTLAKLNSGFDIVSAGELARVLAAKGSPSQVVFSGVGKKSEEIHFALEKNIFCFNIESESELLQINQIAQHLNTIAPISVRVNPDIDSLSHPHITTGTKESKFGVAIENTLSLYRQAKQLPHLRIQGIACHIGSQLTSLSPFIHTCQHLLKLIDTLEESGIKIRYLDLGGGLGVRYHEEQVPTPEKYADSIFNLTQGYDIELILEPGRSIVANAGILVTEVLNIKKAGNKNICVVDAAMNDLIRPTLYQAWQDIIPIHRNTTTPEQLYDVVGPICESADFLGRDRKLSVKPKDLLAICSAGAYGFTMSSNYNSRPRACEIMVNNQSFTVVRQRETIEQLFSQESLC